ncbi:MAG TPA: hypothetical protein VJ962_03065 [Clostridia bacterium]|nr:hypothetical protein [Clostridia bacterium]
MIYITRDRAEQVLPLYPNLFLSKIGNNLEIKTYVHVGEYYVLLKESVSWKNYINYVDLMKFTDSIQVTVNKMKKNFKIKEFLKTKDLDRMSIYKII